MDGKQSTDDKRMIDRVRLRIVFFSTRIGTNPSCEEKEIKMFLWA